MTRLTLDQFREVASRSPSGFLDGHPWTAETGPFDCLCVECGGVVTGWDGGPSIGFECPSCIRRRLGIGIRR